MSTMCYNNRVFTAYIVCTVLISIHGFLTDDISTTANPLPSTPFTLTSTPAHVTRGITQNTTLSCEHDGRTSIIFDEISRIRIMKQTPKGWTLLAQRTISNETSIPDSNVDVTGRIPSNIKETSLQVTWILASEDTFGIYRCDVIGLDNNLDVASQSTPPIHITEQAVTTDDLLTLLLKTREEMSDLSHEVTNKLDRLDREYLKIKENALTKSDAAAWPMGDYALLQPKSGCPVDMTFLGGDDSYFMFHSESSSGTKNDNSYSKAMPLSTTSKFSGTMNMVNLRFCEVRRSFSSTYWPRGKYCITKISGKSCPRDFDEGAITLDAEDNNTMSDLRGNVIAEFGDRVKIEFCCRDGSTAYQMRLPNTSPFLLYRKGGKCQPVRNMHVSDESITIDTEDTNNGDTVSGTVPDINTFNIASKPVRFSLCYYTPDA